MKKATKKVIKKKVVKKVVKKKTKKETESIIINGRGKEDPMLTYQKRLRMVDFAWKTKGDKFFIDRMAELELLENKKDPSLSYQMGFVTSNKKPENTNILESRPFPVAPLLDEDNLLEFENSDDNIETNYVTTRDIKFYVVADGEIRHKTISKGLLTDLASIPKCFLWFVQRDESFILMASVIHDFLLKDNTLKTKDINQTFKDIMFFVIRKKLKNKLSKRIKAHLCYWAVCFYFLFKR